MRRRKSHPRIHPRDPYNPWWWRLWVGLAELVDGVIAVCTLGVVTSGYGSDAAFACLRWGLEKMEKEKVEAFEWEEREEEDEYEA